MPPTQFNPTTITVNEAFEAYTQAHASGCPLVHSGAHGGFWLVVGFDEARSVLADHERFRSGPGVLFPDPGLPKNVPLEFDPPEHRALRAIFTDALTTPKVRATAIHIREHVDALIDTFAPRGTAELCAEYAGPLTLQTIATHVGIALPQLPEMQRVSEALLRSLETPDTRDEAAIADFSAFALELIQSRRAHPRDDPLTVLANAEVDGRTLNPDEAVGYFTGFLIAGHDTTRTSLCRLLDRVGRDDRLRTRLREHPEQTAASSRSRFGCGRHSISSAARYTRPASSPDNRSDRASRSWCPSRRQTGIRPPSATRTSSTPIDTTDVT
jgi:cytochrome P450